MVMVMRLRLRGQIGLLAQPGLHVRALGLGIPEAEIDQFARRNFTADGVFQARARVHLLDPRPERLGIGIRQVRLGHHDPIGHGRLFHRLLVHVQRRHTVDRVQRGNDTVESVAVHQARIVDQGVYDRRRIGQARGLHHDPLERRQLPRHAAALQVAQGLDQVAAHGAAQTAAVQLDDRLLGRSHQQMVQADLAELVDHHRRSGHRRILQQAAEQRGLAAAEKTGQHGNGQEVHDRSLRNEWVTPAYLSAAEGARKPAPCFRHRPGQTARGRRQRADKREKRHGDRQADRL